MGLIKFISIIFASVLISATALSAATIDLNSVNGVWINPQDASGGLPDNFSQPLPNRIQWGFPTGTNNSAYLFTNGTPQLGLSLDTPFRLGTFTHFNFPITGDPLASVDLNVALNLTIDGSPVVFSGTYKFLHYETPDTNGPVDDVVMFLNNISQQQVFSIGGVDYTVGLVGFRTIVGGPILDKFFSKEGAQNSAGLFAQISTPATFAVPEPSTYLILAGLLAISLFIAKKRKKVLETS